MNYVEWFLPSVSNASLNHNVSINKAISFNYSTVCETLMLPAIDTWTTISFIFCVRYVVIN